MIFGNLCTLEVLEPTEQNAQSWKRGISDNAVTQFLFTGTLPQTENDILEKWRREKEAGDYNFAIMSPEGFVGVCGLHDFRSIYRSRELRIIIHDPSMLGKGIGTEATRLLVNYGICRLNLHKVWLGVNVENERAIKCYEKVGFKRDGILRDEVYVNGAYKNVLRMSVLESEWPVTKQ